MMRRYTAISDPGHGWLKVPIADIIETDETLLDQITHCSYLRGDYVYLEEDHDLTIFHNAYVKRFGHAPLMTYPKGSNRSSVIRNYDRYTKERVCRHPIIFYKSKEIKHV